jgi:hypothetical protein
MKITRLAIAGLALALLAGCATATTHNAGPSGGVVVAMNLGTAHLGDLDHLQEALAASGIPCNVGILDLNYAPLLVDAEAAARAKEAAAGIVVRDSLTIRLLKIPVTWESPALVTNTVYEVWEKGKLAREEGFKLY